MGVERIRQLCTIKLNVFLCGLFLHTGADIEIACVHQPALSLRLFSLFDSVCGIFTSFSRAPEMFLVLFGNTRALVVHGVFQLRRSAPTQNGCTGWFVWKDCGAYELKYQASCASKWGNCCFISPFQSARALPAALLRIFFSLSQSIVWIRLSDKVWLANGVRNGRV